MQQQLTTTTSTISSNRLFLFRLSRSSAAAGGGNVACRPSTSRRGDPPSVPFRLDFHPRESCHIGGGNSGKPSKLMSRFVCNLWKFTSHVVDLVGRRSAPHTASVLRVSSEAATDGTERHDEATTVSVGVDHSRPRRPGGQQEELRELLLPIERSFSTAGALQAYAPGFDSVSASITSLAMASSSANSSARSVLSRGTNDSGALARRVRRPPRARSIDSATLSLEHGITEQQQQRQQLQWVGRLGEVVPAPDFTVPLTDSGRSSTETNGSVFEAALAPGAPRPNGSFPFPRGNRNGALFRQ
ncbi:hypothetical protein ZHAS_00006861 [Anopheles sinensis]|uniref:Uncharacterized protein n=1 Tax=Anopheles sinensis TaxID=74873 RepID=A0A084VNH5_ANOSI|nr:hypothetical protein ZHAS_00006861 [Anopheles sinensis]